MYIKTIKDIHPEQIYTTNIQYKSIKKARPNVPFEIKDKSIANELIMIELIKKHIITQHIEVDQENEDDLFYGSIVAQLSRQKSKIFIMN